MCFECGFINVTCNYSYLMISIPYIKFRENDGMMQLIQQKAHKRNRKFIFDSFMIQGSVVDEHFPSVILLPY